MKLYLVSLAMGLLVGVVYSCMGVRSPAPPLIALLGLLGLLVGEQTVPVAKRALSGKPLSLAWFNSECAPKITGAPSTSAVGKNDARSSR